MSNGRTTLHEVCVGGHHECLKLLLKHVENVNVKDRDGQTPAHLAAFNGEVKCLKLLAEKGMCTCLARKNADLLFFLVKLVRTLCKVGKYFFYIQVHLSSDESFTFFDNSGNNIT